jgi:glycosyltransferase involved in cell wall biosynthesis
VLETHPNALLLLAGDGSQRARLEARRIAEARFLDPTSDPLPLLQAADCFVLPSHSEGLSNALLEAMACGLACVATRIGGTVDLMRHADQGLLVEPGDSAALAEALGRALDADTGQRLGAEARARVERDFSLAATADSLASLYRELIESDRRR